MEGNNDAPMQDGDDGDEPRESNSNYNDVEQAQTNNSITDEGTTLPSIEHLSFRDGAPGRRARQMHLLSVLESALEISSAPLNNNRASRPRPNSPTSFTSSSRRSRLRSVLDDALAVASNHNDESLNFMFSRPLRRPMFQDARSPTRSPSARTARTIPYIGCGAQPG